MITCPACDGNKKSVGIGCGPGGCKPMTFKCFTCNGIGEIWEERLKWIETGKKIRERRLERNITQREEARQLGVLPSDYSDIEQGRVENSKWLL